MSIEEKFVNAGDIRTKYLGLGSGKPLILVHRSGNSIDVWKHNIEPFAKKFRVIVPEVAGLNNTDSIKI